MESVTESVTDFWLEWIPAGALLYKFDLESFSSKDYLQ